MDTSRYQVAATLHDGTAVIIRAIHSDDRGPLREQFAQLSPESIRLRFHDLRRSPGESEATQLTDIDFVDQVALVDVLQLRQERLVA